MISILRCFLTSRLISLGLSSLVLFGCFSVADANTKSKGTTPVAPVGHPFDLKAGQEVALNGGKLRIKFAAVPEDSRCPADVTCVWAGNAVVRLDVSTNRSNGRSLTLNTGKTSSLPGEAQYQGYQINLMGLRPYPRSAQKIAASDYTATLLVSNLRAPASGNRPRRNFLTEELITQLEKEGRDATLKNDFEANDRLLADNWMNINPDGSITTKAQLMKLLKAGTFRIMAIENDDVLIRTYGRMAVVTGRSTTKRAAEGDEIISRQVRFTRVYDGSAGRWQVVTAHNTLIRQP